MEGACALSACKKSTPAGRERFARFFTLFREVIRWTGAQLSRFKSHHSWVDDAHFGSTWTASRNPSFARRKTRESAGRTIGHCEARIRSFHWADARVRAKVANSTFCWSVGCSLNLSKLRSSESHIFIFQFNISILDWVLEPELPILQWKNLTSLWLKAGNFSCVSNLLLFHPKMTKWQNFWTVDKT